MRIASELLEQIWFEDQEGNRWVPDMEGEMPPDVPLGFFRMCTQFSNHVTEESRLFVTQGKVDECPHPEERYEKIGVMRDDGVIGICGLCRGRRRTFNNGDVKWVATSAGGEFETASTMSWNPALVLAMVRPTVEEREKQNHRWRPEQPALQVGATVAIYPPLFEMPEAIIIAAQSCSRCLNVLLYTYGLDDGFAEMSDQWKAHGTECRFCEHLGHVRKPSEGSCVEHGDVCNEHF